LPQGEILHEVKRKNKFLYQMLDKKGFGEKWLKYSILIFLLVLNTKWALTDEKMNKKLGIIGGEKYHLWGMEPIHRMCSGIHLTQEMNRKICC
ncbi:hypothetical protein ACJX0J_040915, partial [Zea mays]